MNTSLCLSKKKPPINVYVKKGAFKPTEVGGEFAPAIEEYAENEFRTHVGPLAFLDIGCGPGNTTAHLARACLNAIVYATDVDESAIFSTQKTARINGLKNIRATLVSPDSDFIQVKDPKSST